MDSLGPLLAAALWIVGVLLVVFGVLRVAGYDFDRPWLMWRTKAGPLPVWVYVGFSVVMGLLLLVSAVNR